jgi:hypothetical protein
MFDLLSPCVTCPFRKGQGSMFRLGRLGEIRRAPAFQCHKTIDYSGEEAAPGNMPQQCAGLLTVLWREGELNQIGRVAVRLGSLDPDKLDPRREAYESWDQVVAAHWTGREPE